MGADGFFSRLADTVPGLAASRAPHPMEAASSVELLERYIVEERHRVRLEDLVRDVTEEAVAALQSDAFALTERLHDGSLPARLDAYERAIEPLLGLFVHGCYYGDDAAANVWGTSLSRLINCLPLAGPSLRYGRPIARYPALLLTYGAALASCALDSYRVLTHLVSTVTARAISSQHPLLEAIAEPHHAGYDLRKSWRGMQQDRADD